MINNDILKRALAWSNTPHGIRVAFETDIQAIKSPDIKEAFALEQKKALETPKFFRGSPRTHWYDPQSNCIHVILENIRNEQELDRILLQEILRRRGLAGLVGEKTFDKIAYDAIMAQDEQNRQSFLSYVSGNIRNQQDVIAAGKMFLKAKAEQRAKALSPRSQTNAEQVWFSLTKKFIKKNAPALFNFLSGRDPFWVAMKIREGITQYSFEQKTVAKAVSATESSVEDAIARQHVREVEGRSIDLGGHIVIGLPGQVFLSSAPWARSYPIVLPFSALYKEPDKNYTQRFVSSAYGVKKDKHPYSLLSLIHLKSEMEQPVAVFKSIDRNSGQVLMLPSVGGKVGEETGNFCIPVSPKEINVTREQGLYTNEHSGKWVNYIHSVYPKKDVGVVCWLSLPGLTSYLEDDFEHKWLQPATKRIEAEFDRMFQRAGIKKPSAEDVREILKSVSADDYVDLRSKIARFQDSVLNEAGLPRVYSVYRDILESATKVVKEFENPKFISRQIEFQINNQPHLNMEPKNQLLSFIDSHPENLRRLAYLCAAKSPVFGRELPPINPTEYVVDMSMDDLKETIIEHYPRLSSEDKEMIRAEFPDLPQYMVLDKHSDSYRLATDMAMFMANNLNRVGIKTKVISETEAKEELEKEYLLSKDGVEARNFSVRDIMNLSYTWNGEEVSMRGFAEQFMSEIKQKDRTMEDAERIAKAFIAAVKEDPEKAGMKMLKAENMANAFRFKLPDGTVYTPEHPMASSPEYETQKGLWLIYERVLGEDTMREFIGLLSKNSPMSADERKRFSELESKVNGSSLMQDSLEVPASKVNENRVKDIRNLIQYFEGNEDYTWTEKALIVKGAMSFGYSEKKESDQTKVEIKNISDNNSVAVPVIGGEAAAVVEGLRKGLNFKDALVQARISLSKESKRSVARNFTGWKVYKQSDKEEDAVILNQDVAGTGWCTGGAVSTARSHLSGGDFHVYYEAGEPLIAIRTKDGRMAEPPRGAHEGQFCTDREEQIAFDYIKSGNGISAGDDYIADIEDIRRVMSPNATPKDAFLVPNKRRYQNGEFGGDTKDWGNAVKERIKELVPQDVNERWRLGLYYGNEIEDACRNGNAVVLKGYIELFGSSSLTLPKGVTKVGNINLHGSSSLTLLEGVTKVGSIGLYNSSSLILPEGVTKVGSICLGSSSSLNLPEGVTEAGYIELFGSSSLTLPEGVTRVGNFILHGSSSLTLPKGIIQVSSRLTLSPDSSLVFPDGFVLHNGLNDTKRYSPKTINELLREHGEQKERSFQFRLSDGTVYGYQLGDTIYLTPKGINPNTPIHEYAHIWAKVYERLHPEEWDSLKEELKALPLWNHIASSESYDFIKDENRLAGEVLATLVGNKGEELLVDTAKDVIESTFLKSVPDKEVQFAIQQFKDKLTNLAVKDVFNAEGMEHTGDVTLMVLKDFAEGKGIKLNKDEVDKIAANYSIKDNSNTNDMEDNIYFDGQDEQYPIIEPMESTSAIISPDGEKRSRSKKHYEKDEFDKYYGDIIDGLQRASKRAEDLLKQAVEVNDENRQQFSTASDAVSHARMELEAAEKERKSSSQSGSIASGAATLLWLGSLVGLLYGFGGLFLLASAALGAAKISNKIRENNSQRKIEQLNEKISSLKEKKEAADIAYKNSQMQKEKASLEKKRIDSTIKYNQREQKKRIKEQGTKPKIVKTPAETLAANASMWLVGRLNAVGIKTVLVSQDTAKKLLDEDAVLSARVGKETLYGEDDVMRFRRMSDKERHDKGIYFANELHGSGPMPSMVKTVICNVFNGFETISPIYYNIEHIYGDARLTGGDYDNLVSVKGRLLIEGEVSAKSLSEVTRKAIIDSGYGTAALYAPNLDKSSRRNEEIPHDYDDAYFDRNASKTTLSANYEGSDTFAFHTSSGVVYGFQKNDTIYLTEDGIDANTPIHEYAHLWAEVARRTAPSEWSGIVEAMKTSPMWASVVNDPLYVNLNGDENRIASEVLARITGNNAETLLKVAAEQFAEQSDMTNDDKIRNTVALMREGIGQIIANNLFNGVQLREFDKVSLKVIIDMVDLKQMERIAPSEQAAASMKGETEENPYIGITKDGYRPNPIDISSVEMTPELTETIEMLASVTYENTRRTYNLTMGRYDAFIRYSKDADKDVSWEEASEEVKKAFLEPSEEICKSIEASVGLKTFMAMNDADKDNVIKDVARSLHDLFVEELIDKGYHYDPESTNPEEWDMAPHSDETGVRTDFKAYDAKESLRLIAAVDAKEAEEQLELNNDFMSSPAADYLVKKVNDAIVRTNGLNEEALGNAITLVGLAFVTYGTEGLLNPNASVPVIEINGLKGNPAFAGVDDTVLNALVDACHDIGYACLNAIGADPADYFPLKESINWNSVYGLPETYGARIVKNTLVQAVQYEAEISYGPFPSSIGHFKRQIEKVKADNTIISLIPRDEDKIRLMTSETLEYALRNAGFIKPDSNIYTIKQTEDGLRLAASYKKDEFMLTSAYLTHEGDGELSYAVAPTRFENIFDTELNDLESVLNAFEKNIEGMNVFELAGANKLAHEISEALNTLKETYRNVEKLEEMSDHFVKETMTRLDERLSLAITEYERFIGRGYRENNNLWDTITGNRFEPTIPLPEKEVINEKVAAGKDVWRQISDAEFNSRQYNKYVEKELGHDHLLLPANYRSLPVNDESQHGDFSVVETRGKYNIVDGQGRKLLDQDADKITVKDHPRQETTIERQQINPYQEFIIERQGDSRTVNSDQLKEVSRKKVATETIVPTPAGGRHFTPKEIDSLCQGNVVYAEGIPYMFREGDGKGADLAHLPGAVYNESGKPTAISRELFEYFVAHPDKDLMVVSADALKEYGIGLQDGALKFNTLKEVVPMNEIAKNAISPLVRNALSNVNSSKTYCKADALHVKGVLEKFKPEAKKGPSRGVAHDPGKAQGAARKK